MVIDSCNQCVRGRVKPDPLWMSYLLLLTCLFSGLTLLVLDSNLCKNNDLLTLDDGLDGMYEFIGPCTISGGAKKIISATVFWFMAGIGSLMAYSHQRFSLVPFFDGLITCFVGVIVPLFDSDSIYAIHIICPAVSFHDTSITRACSRPGEINESDWTS